MHITVNTTELELIRARQSLMGGSIDSKRPTAWDSYGYKTDLVFEDYWNAYTRGGPAHGAVHRILDGCWQQLPRVKSEGAEEETPWEKKVAELFKSTKAWSKLRDLDRRNMIGRYAGLILRVADGLALSEPLISAKKLVDLVPVYENQLQVTAWHSDTTSPDYGKPAMYQYRKKALNQDKQGMPEEWADVHPSRVIIMAEGSVGDMFDGVPMLRAGFNALVDLEKIGGGSAESFLKNSSRALTFTYDPQAQPSTIGDDGSKTTVKAAHEQQVRALNSNIDAAIVTQGATVGTLQTTIADPTGAFNLAGNLFAASIRLPFTIVFGQQTGRLASDQDKADANARFKSRQTNEITPVIEALIVRLQACGIVEAGAFSVEWPDVSAPSDEQKLTLADKMAAINERMAKIGQSLAFSEQEIRTAGGYDEEEMPDAIDPPDTGDTIPAQ